MNATEKAVYRRTTWAGPKPVGEPDGSPFRERESALAQLVGTPGWEALKSILQALAPFHVPDIEDLRFDDKLKYHTFRAQFVVQIIKVVEDAPQRVKLHAKEPSSP